MNSLPPSGSPQGTSPQGGDLGQVPSARLRLDKAPLAGAAPSPPEGSLLDKGPPSGTPLPPAGPHAPTLPAWRAAASATIVLAATCAVALWALPTTHPVRSGAVAVWERAVGVWDGWMDAPGPSSRFVRLSPEESGWRPRPVGVSPDEHVDPPPVSIGGEGGDVAPGLVPSPYGASPSSPSFPSVGPSITPFPAVPAFPLPPRDVPDVAEDVRARLAQSHEALGVGWSFDDAGVLWTDGGEEGHIESTPITWAGLFPEVPVQPDKVAFIPSLDGAVNAVFVEANGDTLTLYPSSANRLPPGSSGPSTIDLRLEDRPFRGGWKLDGARPTWRSDGVFGAGFGDGAIAFTEANGLTSPFLLDVDVAALASPNGPAGGVRWRVYKPLLPTPAPVPRGSNDDPRATAEAQLADFTQEAHVSQETIEGWMQVDARSLLLGGPLPKGWTPLVSFGMATWSDGTTVAVLPNGSVSSKTVGAWDTIMGASLWEDMSVPFVAGPPDSNPIVGNAHVQDGTVTFAISSLNDEGVPRSHVSSYWQAPEDWIRLFEGGVAARTLLLDNQGRIVVRFQSLDTGMVGFVRMYMNASLSIEATPLFSVADLEGATLMTATPLNRAEAMDLLPASVRSGWRESLVWPSVAQNNMTYPHESVGGTWDPKLAALARGEGYVWAMDRLQVWWMQEDGMSGHKVLSENIAFFRGFLDGNVVDGRLPFLAVLPSGFALAGWVPAAPSDAAKAYVVGINSALWDAPSVLPSAEALAWTEAVNSQRAPWARILRAHAWPDGGVLLRVEDVHGLVFDVFWDMQTGQVRRFW